MRLTLLRHQPAIRPAAGTHSLLYGWQLHSPTPVCAPSLIPGGPRAVLHREPCFSPLVLN